MAEDRTTAIGLARYARDYFDAALAADHDLGRRPGYEIVAPAPVMSLVAQSIELGLKAYLRFKGLSLDEIKTLGHRLTDCWQAAVVNDIENHVSLTAADLEVLEIISNLHASTQLRYIETGFKQFPVFGPLETLARKLLDTICPLVGYK